MRFGLMRHAGGVGAASVPSKSEAIIHACRADQARGEAFGGLWRATAAGAEGLVRFSRSKSSGRASVYEHDVELSDPGVWSGTGGAVVSVESGHGPGSAQADGGRGAG